MPKIEFAHYFTPYPISLDNKVARVDGATSGGDGYDTAYLDPGGEKGIHAAYGGLLRDRPIPRAPYPSGVDWQAQDMQTEVRQAMAAGLNGFTLDLLGGPSPTSSSVHLRRQEQLMQAAVDVSPSFKIMPMPDMQSWTTGGSTDPTKVISDSTAAARIKKLANYSSAFRLPDGRLVISPFFAERWTPARWKTALTAIEAAVGAVAFVPCFLNYSSNIAAFMTIPQMYGASIWGDGNPGASANDATLAANAHSRGLIWMQPIIPQDERPNQNIYDEAGNTENLRATWMAAINGNADWVQGRTWNDYSEGAQLAPSKFHGWSFAQLSKHYADWWKSGSEAAPVRDEIYLTHRKHAYNATPSGGQTKLMTLRSGSTAARNTIEALTILTAPATVQIKVNGTVVATQSRPAGLAVGPTGGGSGLVTLPASGEVSASVARAGETPLTVTTPAKVVGTPIVQDLQYVAATAARSVSTVPRLLGINDPSKPTGLVDTLEGAYSSGSGSGTSFRLGSVHEISGWSALTTALTTSDRTTALFKAGHSLLLSFRAPATYSAVTNGSNDAAIDAFGDRLYALGFGAAVSGTQPGVSYGGTTATSIRVSFMPQPETDTTRGTATEFKAAWRYFFNRIKARKPSGAPERIVTVMIYTVQSQGNGQASTYYPGNTATDHVDEIGVNGYVATSSWTSFADFFGPWHTWSAANANSRKICIAQTAAAADARQAAWVTDMAQTLLDDLRYSAVHWWSPDNYTTTPDGRAMTKANNPTLWQAWHDAQALVDAAGDPAPDVTPPAVPTGLSATTLTSTSVTLTWNQPGDPDLTSYQLSRDGVIIASPSSPSATAYTVSGQTPEATHVYRVASVDGNGNVSSFSGPLTVVHPAVAAYDPPSITAAAVPMDGLTATGSVTASDPAGGTLVIVWTWGDGSSDTGPNPTHAYLAPGNYTVTVTATSLTSGQPTSQVLTAAATLGDGDATAYLNMPLPIIGQHVGLFGTKLIGILRLLDQVIQRIDQRKVQNGTGTPFVARSTVSYQNGLTVTDEDSSTDYPDGRTIVAGSSDGNALTLGESNMRRTDASVAITLSTGTMRLGYFTARKTETITQLRMGVTAAAAATPTLSRIGVYSVAGDGALTLVAATASDTALFTTAGNVTKALTAAWSKVAGQRYAIAALCVTSAGAPTVSGVVTGTSAEAALDPQLCGSVVAQTDLPASVAGPVPGSPNLPYFVAVP